MNHKMSHESLAQIAQIMESFRYAVKGKHSQLEDIQENV